MHEVKWITKSRGVITERKREKRKEGREAGRKEGEEIKESELKK